MLIIGINPWSTWGLRHVFAHDALRQARCISPSRVADWLNLLGFALEKRRFGGFYLLVARKIVVGLRPLRQERREPMGKLIPLPMAKVNRRRIEP